MLAAAYNPAQAVTYKPSRLSPPRPAGMPSHKHTHTHGKSGGLGPFGNEKKEKKEKCPPARPLTRGTIPAHIHEPNRTPQRHMQTDKAGPPLLTNNNNNNSGRGAGALKQRGGPGPGDWLWRGLSHSPSDRSGMQADQGPAPHSRGRGLKRARSLIYQTAGQKEE